VVATLLLAAMPVSELRGAIPFGVASGLALPTAVGVSIIGNLLPVVPILWWLAPVERWLVRFRFWKRFFDWLDQRSQTRARIVQRYQLLGLALFVSIPLPITGAWTGCAAAVFFRLPRRQALVAICCGVMMAALIVGSVTAATISAFQ